MHPATAFRSTADPLAFAAAHAFAHIFAITPDGPRVAHAPLLLTGAGQICFHLSNANTLTPHLDGATALLSIGGPGSYISPNWYRDPAMHVPTWNYQAVEIEGSVRALDADALADLIDLSAETFEPRVGQDWTMAKLAPDRAHAMMRAITGFALTPTAVRSTEKASQNRSEDDARRLFAALEAIGDTAGANMVRRTRGW